ncbi:MAG: class I SAM-dependent methyltransferase [Planctomycetota bacterium]
MTDETANPAFYDADSATYDDQRWTSRAGAFTNRVQQRLLVELCRGWRDHDVLEVGSGTARFSIPLCGQGNRMTLVDIAPGMLDVARGKIEEAGLAEHVVDMVCGSIYELPFDDGAFDHAISLNVFNHLERAGDALAELARVTKPGSTLLFNYANLGSWYWPAARRISRRGTAAGQDVFSTWERPRDVKRMIDAAGLDLVACRGHVHMPRGLERRAPWLLSAIRGLDLISRRPPLRRLAAVHFCLCRKRN